MSFNFEVNRPLLLVKRITMMMLIVQISNGHQTDQVPVVKMNAPAINIQSFRVLATEFQPITLPVSQQAINVRRALSKLTDGVCVFVWSVSEGESERRDISFSSNETCHSNTTFASIVNDCDLLIQTVSRSNAKMLFWLSTHDGNGLNRIVLTCYNLNVVESLPQSHMCPSSPLVGVPGSVMEFECVFAYHARTSSLGYHEYPMIMPFVTHEAFLDDSTPLNIDAESHQSDVQVNDMEYIRVLRLRLKLSEEHSKTIVKCHMHFPDSHHNRNATFDDPIIYTCIRRIIVKVSSHAMKAPVVMKANRTGELVVACPWRCSECSYKFTDKRGGLLLNDTGRVILLTNVSDKQTILCTPSDGSKPMAIVIQPHLYPLPWDKLDILTLTAFIVGMVAVIIRCMIRREISYREGVTGTGMELSSVYSATGSGTRSTFSRPEMRNSTSTFMNFPSSVINSPRDSAVFTSPRHSEVFFSPRNSEMFSSTRNSEVFSSPQHTEVLFSPRSSQVSTSPRNTEAFISPRSSQVSTSPRNTEAFTDVSDTSSGRGFIQEHWSRNDGPVRAMRNDPMESAPSDSQNGCCDTSSSSCSMGAGHRWNRPSFNENDSSSIERVRSTAPSDGRNSSSRYRSLNIRENRQHAHVRPYSTLDPAIRRQHSNNTSDERANPSGSRD